MSSRGALRVLPLGGLGEIGKNMTVVEYDDRIVVVDTGLMFPAPDQLGIDLVLPDFTYLRERAADIEAIVLTHGHEDHVGALPFVLRQLGLPYETVIVDLFRRETRTPEHLARNPDGKVPVLETDDGELIPESAAILLHLAEGTAFLPAGGGATAAN